MLKPDESRKRSGEAHGKMALGWTAGACNGRRKRGGQSLTCGRLPATEKNPLTVIQEPRTSNIAREASLLAGVPDKIPAHTVTLACISSNVAMTQGMGMIATGNANAVIAGGVELLSDLPIRYNKSARGALLGFAKAKDVPSKLKVGSEFVKNALFPELPVVTEFSSGETMGHSGDRLAASFNISRREQDEFAMRSHTFAAEAAKNGKLSDIIPVFLDGKKPVTIKADNGIRVSSMDKLS
uniref:Thiolase_N domain-containing protein n=1 Tax=Caenorhabditis japonica TaxID=281687 RepID=A0A8R1EN08_CAEJA